MKEYLVSSRVANTLPHSAFVEAPAHANLAQLNVSYLLKLDKEESDFDILHGDASDNASVLYNAPFCSLCSDAPFSTPQSCQIW